MKSRMYSVTLLCALCAALLTGVAAAEPVELPEGVSPEAVTANAEIRGILASATEAAITENGFQDLQQLFVEPDRRRIGLPTVMQLEDVNETISEFRAEWKNRYGEEFEVDNSVEVFNEDFATIRQGRITNPAMTREWPLDPTFYVEIPKVNGDDAAYLRDMPRVAVVTLPAAGGLPQFNVSMVEEDPGVWKLDIPDNIDTGQLTLNLVQHINDIGKVRGSWPEDVNEAYRMAGRHIVMALYNVNAPPPEES